MIRDIKTNYLCRNIFESIETNSRKSFFNTALGKMEKEGEKKLEVIETRELGLLVFEQVQQTTMKVFRMALTVCHAW